MGRELQLGWPGRVLEPVGLAQGGLATDPGGDGMKSGTSQNTSPGFGAFLAFPPPMAACLAEKRGGVAVLPGSLEVSQGGGRTTFPLRKPTSSPLPTKHTHNVPWQIKWGQFPSPVRGMCQHSHPSAAQLEQAYLWPAVGPKEPRGSSALPGKSASMLVFMCMLRGGLYDVCGLDRAFQRVHHRPGRKRGI
ncbi:unnamed protein product [Pleuronectes platessa]|uniref:Uncharacterized protein n=1 Tax=Pleuronectes platessa TaxID=8262 RepID=A0A9N7VIG2_PLEPL|nr:unnamed protein product [Pleuronectes platessa]